MLVRTGPTTQNKFGEIDFFHKGPFFYEWFFESEEGGGWDWVGGS